MNREQMLGSLQRIFVLQYFKTEEQNPYGEVIFEHCSWMDAYRFEAAVKEVVKTLKTNQRLKPAHFISAYYRLSEEHGWSRAATKTCPGCQSLHFIPVWCRDKKGLEFRAVRGCPECNSRFAQVHPDFEQIPYPPSTDEINVEKLRTIPPVFAQILLDTADVCKIQLKPDQSDALMQAAAKHQPHQVAPRRYNHVTRKNELVRALITTPPSEGEAEREASVGGQPAGVVEVGSSPPPAQVPELTEEDLADIPF